MDSKIIGIVSNYGLRTERCDQGVIHIKNTLRSGAGMPQLHWADAISFQDFSSPPDFFDGVYQLAKKQLSLRPPHSRNPLLFFTGDHSSAIGIWPAAIDLYSPENFGLIWIDAHLDAHNHETSPSGNIHGMPVLALLGGKDPVLSSLYPGHAHLKPEHLQMIGIRSYEEDEMRFLNPKNVGVFLAKEVADEESMRKTLDQCMNNLRHCTAIGVSLDLDAIEPEDFPAVSTPEPQGIPSSVLQPLLKTLADDDRLVAVEIAEFNPSYDQDGKSEKLLKRILATLAPATKHQPVMNQSQRTKA